MLFSLQHKHIYVKIDIAITQCNDTFDKVTFTYTQILQEEMKIRPLRDKIGQTTIFSFILFFYVYCYIHAHTCAYDWRLPFSCFIHTHIHTNIKLLTQVSHITTSSQSILLFGVIMVYMMIVYKLGWANVHEMLC